MRGQDKDGGLTEVAEQTGPDRKSSLEEPAPSPTWVPGRPRKRPAQPPGASREPEPR